MKSLAELHALRDKLKSDLKLRHNTGIKIIVSMGTCGIAAGAREVLSTIMDEVAKRKLNDVLVQTTGCKGMCEKEVIVDVALPDEPLITYGKVKPEDVPQIIDEHVIAGRLVENLVIGKIEKD